MSKPLLSIGMIVRNDIRSIERCLRALQPLRDALSCELVIADTGSTDGTREVAARYADLLFDLTWPNDFSAARNAVMERCQGAWYFTVDADEYLDNPDELIFFLKNPNKNPAVASLLVLQRNYTTRTMDGEYSDFPAERLLRMDTGLRYQGAIHEYWPVREAGFYSGLLSKTILHHDGYTYTTPEEAQAKARRNLVLLERLIQQFPLSCRRMVQCLESSMIFPDMAWGFAQMGMKLVAQKPSQEPWKWEWEQFGPAVVSLSVRCAAMYGHQEEQKQWSTLAIQLFPNSLYTQIDVAYLNIKSSYKARNYLDVIGYYALYRQGLGCVESDPTLLQFCISKLFGAMPSARHEAFHIYLDSLCACKMFQDMKKELERISVSKEDQQGCIVFLGYLTKLFHAGISVEELVCQLTPILSDTELPTAYLEFLQAVKDLFTDHSEYPTYQIFESLVETDIGRAVQLMRCSDAQTACVWMEQIRDWRNIPVDVLAHLLEYTIPLPDKFYELSADMLRVSAGQIAVTWSDATNKVLGLHPQMKDCVGLVKLQFFFDLSLAAVRRETWEDAVSSAALMRLCVSLSKQYLPAYYNPALLSQPEHWNVLPGMHQFILYIGKASEIAQSAQLSQYPSVLRAALEAAPVMKQAVAFLLEHPAALCPPVSPELEALAAQINQILASYPPDDPAVVQLKASPAYQKVAYLLDGDIQQ